MNAAGSIFIILQNRYLRSLTPADIVLTKLSPGLWDAWIGDGEYGCCVTERTRKEAYARALDVLAKAKSA